MDPRRILRTVIGIGLATVVGLLYYKKTKNHDLAIALTAVSARMFMLAGF